MVNNSNSQSQLSNASIERLRKKFAAWTLAIAGSLTTSATVMLPSSVVWGSEDQKSEEKTTSTEKAKIESQEFRKLLSENKLGEAAAQIDQALADDPESSELLQLNMMLAMYQIRSDAKAGKERYVGLIDRLLAMKEIDSRSAVVLSQSVQMYGSTLSREGKNDDALALLDRAFTALGSQNSPQRASLLTTKGRLLISAGRAQQAKEILDENWNLAFKTAQESPSPRTISDLTAQTTNFSTVLSSEYPKDASAKLEQADKLVRDRLDSEDATPNDFVAFYSLYSSIVSRSIYSDAKRADALIKDLQVELDKIKTKLNEDQVSQLAMIERSLRSLAGRVEDSLRREKLIGTRAPEFESESFVAIEPITMEQLKGKVVLVDFWAVWCGPCIATFPHLIHLHEEFGDKGLVIVGMTKNYGYDWDESAQRAVRSAGATAEQELTMLEKFREHHKLRHGFIVAPEKASYFSEFEVAGIPQAAVIDQLGIIQLIRVGSGQENAKAIESKIKELLEKGPGDPQ